jgi:hypothetical protein
MIKLTEIVREISFQKGHASQNKIEDISSDALSTSDIDDDLDRPGDYDELELPVNDKQFQNSFKKKMIVIDQYNQYNLVKSKKPRYRNEIAYYLVDTKAPSIGEFFVGVIKTEINSGNRYKLKKAFEIEIETVHWSNVAQELRGTGMGKIMYSMVYKHVISKGMAFGSDSMLYEGSAGMWMTYMPTLATYFGVIINEILVPIPAEELTKKNKSIFGIYGVDGFVAMENPPPTVRKIAYNVKGLSFVRGEYGVALMYDSVNAILDIEANDLHRLNRYDDDYEEKRKKPKGEPVRFIDYVNNFTTIKQLLNSEIKYEISDIVGSKKTKYKTIIFAFLDAMLVVKQLPDKLSVTPI